MVRLNAELIGFFFPYLSPLIHVILLNIPEKLKLDWDQKQLFLKVFIRLTKLDKIVLYLYQCISSAVFIKVTCSCVTFCMTFNLLIVLFHEKEQILLFQLTL